MKPIIPEAIYFMNAGQSRRVTHSRPNEHVYALPYFDSGSRKDSGV